MIIDQLAATARKISEELKAANGGTLRSEVLQDRSAGWRGIASRETTDRLIAAAGLARQLEAIEAVPFWGRERDRQAKIALPLLRVFGLPESTLDTLDREAKAGTHGGHDLIEDLHYRKGPSDLILRLAAILHQYYNCCVHIYLTAWSNLPSNRAETEAEVSESLALDHTV